MRRLLTGVRRSFLAGLFLVLPAAVTAYILYLGFRLLGGLARPAVDRTGAWLGLTLWPGAAPVLSLVLTVAALVLLGAAGRSYIGARLLKLLDALALRIPLAKTLYSATRRLVDSFSGPQAYQKVVLVQFPREGTWSVGFCTGDPGPRLSKVIGEEVLSVFVPTTPNPTSGFLVMVRRDEVRQLDITVEEGAAFIMSGGVAAPGRPPAAEVLP